MEKQIIHFSHWHYLRLDQQKRKEGDQMTCNGCENKISGDFYGCTKCKHYVCKSCVGLAPEIRHPFHTKHPLTLFAQTPYEESRDPDHQPPYGHSVPYCNPCGMRCDGFIFHCSECQFDLHLNCATLMPTTNNYKTSEQQTPHLCLLRSFSNKPHPLIPCYRKNKQLDFVCSVCKQHIKGTIYACLDCHAIMDESCIQLPHQITHHLHPQHTLTLEESYGDYAYNCKECNFRLDVSNHRHSLSLTYSLVKDHSDDDEDSEYYCDVCEELRNLWEPTYYCKDCHYVAHTSCAFHEILFLLGMEWPLALDEEIVNLQAKVDSLISKVDEIKERRANEYKIWLEKGDRNTAILDAKISMHEKEENALTNKLKTLTTKLDELKEGHPKHIGGYQIGSIPSLGTKSSMTVLDISNEVKEDCTVKSMKKDEDIDVGANTNSYVTILGRSDVVVEECCSVKSTKKGEDEDEESDCTFSTLANLDEEIVAIKIMIETLSTKLEALEKKRARCVSHLELK
ncbi:uncharacterized protein LOC132303536 isoform X4 [Cornus florida]|uniref:uncharacterized protein LOC132303536 isoform X4 n=1 Tax=Cornus florida TaxID=4283 RepID=UPI00289E7335|nr:uncharacterized protein LOC132303536 isoform X4 [Cornus florida]